MGVKRGISEEAANSLITADFGFFEGLALDPRLNPIRPVALLALLPLTSAFLVESAAFLTRHKLGNPAIEEALRPHNALLTASRQRLKLLDDRRQSFDEIIRSANELSGINSNWFLENRSGILGPLKRFV